MLGAYILSGLTNTFSLCFTFLYSLLKFASAVYKFVGSGLSHPFLGIGPGPLELGKIVSFKLKLGKKYNVLCMKFLLSD